MDKIIGAVIFLWLAAMAVGLVIAAMPIILAVVGFVLMYAFLNLIGIWVGSLFK